MPPYSFESSLREAKKKFIQSLVSNSSFSPLTNDVLESFYNVDSKNAANIPAIIRQKIIIVPSDYRLSSGDDLEVIYSSSQLNGPGGQITCKVKRVSEYPNHNSEFNNLSTNTVLLEWEDGPEFIYDLTLKKEGEELKIMIESHQFDNFLISPTPPNSDPDPPIRSTYLAPGILSVPVARSNYTNEIYTFIEEHPNQQIPSSIKVVVSDTGLKFKLDSEADKYKTNFQVEIQFPTAGNPNHVRNNDTNKIGFSSLTNYLDNNYFNNLEQQQMRDAILPNGSVSPSDEKVLANPYDDHPARHGTFVTAIVAQNSLGNSQIIPLKIFDFLGYGNLFDILCGFNYIFSRLQARENIRVVNASWGIRLPNNDSLRFFNLLEKKIQVLAQQGVFVVAAAGNRRSLIDSHNELIESGTDISNMLMLPACYSTKYDNVITVTSVVEKWKTRVFAQSSVSKYVNKDLCRKLLKTNNVVTQLWNSILTILPNGYKPIENYSREYVQVGVVAHPFGGFFPTPFDGIKRIPIAGSSFATAYMSAYIVNFLKKNKIEENTDINLTRQQILNSLPTHSSLGNSIEGNRFLELDKVTGRNVSENFESVLNAIISANP